MKKQNMYHSLMLVMLVCGLILFPYSPLASAEVSQPKPVKLKVLLLPYLSFAPFFIAEEEGYFAEQGLEIEFVKMDRSAEAIPLLVQGDVDVIPGDIWIGTLNVIDRGATLKIVADKGYIGSPAECAYTAFLTSPELKNTGALDTPDQLKGRRIAVNPQGHLEYIAEKTVNAIGLQFHEVETVRIQSSARLDALESGAIDILSATEPLLTRFLRTGKAVLWKSANEVVPGLQYNGIMYGPSLLNDNPEAGRRFMVAYLKAVRQYNQGKTPRNLEIVAKHTELELDLLQDACWLPIRTDGHINLNSVLDFQQWAKEKKLLDTIVSEEQLWDGSFIEYANQVLGVSPKE